MIFLDTAIQVASGWVSLEISVAVQMPCLLKMISAPVAAYSKLLVDVLPRAGHYEDHEVRRSKFIIKGKDRLWETGPDDSGYSASPRHCPGRMDSSIQGLNKWGHQWF